MCRLTSTSPSIPRTIGVFNVYRFRIRNAVVIAACLPLLSFSFTDWSHLAVTSVQAHLRQASQFRYSARPLACASGATFGILFTPDGAGLPCLGLQCNADLARLVCSSLDSPVALDTVSTMVIASVSGELLNPIWVVSLLTNSGDLTRRVLPRLLM